MIAALAPRVQHARTRFRGEGVSKALSGMERLHDSPEVRDMLTALAPKVRGGLGQSALVLSKAKEKVNKIEAGQFYGNYGGRKIL